MRKRKKYIRKKYFCTQKNCGAELDLRNQLRIAYMNIKNHRHACPCSDCRTLHLINNDGTALIVLTKNAVPAYLYNKEITETPPQKVEV